MQRIPLKDSRLVAALIAIGVPKEGFKTEALHHTGDGRKVTSWYLETDRAADIQELMAYAKPDHPRALWRTDPDNPFLVALAAIENHAVLSRVMSGKGEAKGLVAAAQGSKARKLSGFAHDVTADFATTEIAMAAAFATMGFHPAYGFWQNGQYAFRALSVSFPDLTHRICAGAMHQMTDRHALAPVDLPGYPPGCHPLCYAFAAAHGLRLIAPVEAKAWETPVHFFPGSGGRSAIANDTTLRNDAFYKQLRPHLAGV